MKIPQTTKSKLLASRMKRKFASGHMSVC